MKPEFNYMFGEFYRLLQGIIAEVVAIYGYVIAFNMFFAILLVLVLGYKVYEYYDDQNGDYQAVPN